MRVRTALLAILVVIVLAVGGVALTPRASVPTTEASVDLTASGDFSSSSAASAVLADIRASGSDLHLALGDLSYGQTGAEQTWCDFVTARVGAGFPFELVAGNHESNGQNGNINDFSACLPNQLPGLVGSYGRQWYVDVPREAPLVRVVAISPGVPFSSGDWSYAAGSARYAWTAAAIDGARQAGIPWVVAALHKPCLSVGLYGCEAGADVTNLLVEKKVDLVLSGHEHSYARTHQIRLGNGCSAVVPGAYDPDCVADTDNAYARGAGTVFATVGTGGTALRDVNPADAEAPYFAAFSGGNANPTWGSLHVSATADALVASFRRASGGTFTDRFTVAPPDPAGNTAPTASFTHSTDGLSLSVNGSGSTDADGTISSHAWSFGDGGTAAGATATHAYAAPGAYDVTLTVSDDDGATASRTVRVEVTAGQETVVARDLFDRTVTSGWGSAPTGGAWTVGSGSFYSVDAGVGRVTMGTAGAGRSTFLAGVSATSADALVSAGVDKAATGGGTDLTVVGRRTTSGNEYRAQIKVLSTGGVRVGLQRLAGGSATMLAQVNAPGLTYSAGQRLRIRLQVVGASPTTLRTKVWTAGTPEPPSWLLERTDSTAALQGPGAVGLLTYVSSSATNAPVQATFDDLVVTVP